MCANPSHVSRTFIKRIFVICVLENHATIWWRCPSPEDLSLVKPRIHLAEVLYHASVQRVATQKTKYHKILPPCPFTYLVRAPMRRRDCSALHA